MIFQTDPRIHAYNIIVTKRLQRICYRKNKQNIYIYIIDIINIQPPARINITTDIKYCHTTIIIIICYNIYTKQIIINPYKFQNIHLNIIYWNIYQLKILL